MTKVNFKPGTMVYPVPVVMVSCGTSESEYNIITIAWTGTICSDPAMTYISVRKERHSYDLIMKSKEFVINLTTEQLAFATDFCGVKSGRDINKFEAMNLTPLPSTKISSPLIKECPVNIECKVTQVIELGSHDMFIAEVVAVNVDEKLIDNTGKFDLEKSNLICYSHGQYYGLTKSIGKFGYSIMKEKTKKKLSKNNKSNHVSEKKQNKMLQINKMAD